MEFAFELLVVYGEVDGVEVISGFNFGFSAVEFGFHFCYGIEDVFGCGEVFGLCGYGFFEFNASTSGDEFFPAGLEILEVLLELHADLGGAEVCVMGCLKRLPELFSVFLCVDQGGDRSPCGLHVADAEGVLGAFFESDRTTGGLVDAPLGSAGCGEGFGFRPGGLSDSLCHFFFELRKYVLGLLDGLQEGVDSGFCYTLELCDPCHGACAAGGRYSGSFNLSGAIRFRTGRCSVHSGLTVREAVARIYCGGR